MRTLVLGAQRAITQLFASCTITLFLQLGAASGDPTSTQGWSSRTSPILDDVRIPTTEWSKLGYCQR